jgi:hypothetical protein
MALFRTEDYQQNGYQNHPTIQFSASQAGTILRSMLMVAQGSNARIGCIGHLWGEVAEFSPTGRGSRVCALVLTAAFSEERT